MKRIIFFLIPGLVICPYASTGASFNCGINEKSGIEVTICNSTHLSTLDSEMSDAYFKLLNTPKVNKSTLRKSQRSWLKSREELCFGKNESNASPEQCLSRLYEFRIGALLSHPLAGSDLPD